MSTTVTACIQQIPLGDGEKGADGAVLEVQNISATADGYLAAVDAVESQVPEGWRVLYVRSDEPQSTVTEDSTQPAEVDATQPAPLDGGTDRAIDAR